MRIKIPARLHRVGDRKKRKQEVKSVNYLLSGLTIYTADATRRADVFIRDGRIAAISPLPSPESDTTVIEFTGCCLFPGFADVHVHLREPGFSYKETVASGTRAAARGGFTSICAMPNLKPVPDSRAHLAEQLDLLAQGALVSVHAYGAISVGEQGRELADLEGMAPDVIAFSDDGRGVQRDELMKEAMRRAKGLGKLIVAHCEDERLLRAGYIHDGDYARAHGHKGICSESEWGQVQRDLDLVRQTGCAYHVCHVSTKETVALIRAAKREGLDVTCETAPHYLILTDADLQEDGRFKMNPPLRGAEDRAALRAGLLDGTVDMIATDHAPHSQEEKSRGLQGSMMGIVGLETAFPLLYTHLVKSGFCTLGQLISWLHDKPTQRFGIGTPLAVGERANFTVFDLNQNDEIDPAHFVSKGRSTPFQGTRVWGLCKLTMADGKIAWEE